MSVLKHVSFALAAALVLSVAASPARAQSLQEDFEGAAGDGGEFFTGSGSGESLDPPGWDSNLTGENARVSTTGNAGLDASAQAVLGQGNPGNAGQLLISNLAFDLIDQDFFNVTGTGGGQFLPCGDPSNCFTAEWDLGIQAEAAFAGVDGGEVATGTVSAQGLTNGGIDGLGGGQIVVSDLTVTAGDWFAGIFFDIGAFPNATPLFNPGFESGQTGWDFGGNVFATFRNDTGLPDEIIIPRTGNWLGKMFGSFNGNPEGTSLFQTIPAQPGQTWEFDGFVRHNDGDSLADAGNNADPPSGPGPTQNEVIMRLEYLDAADAVIASDENIILTSASPEDTWIDVPAITLAAPANTVAVRPSFIFDQFCDGGDPLVCDQGAAHFDDVSFKIVGGPSPVDLSLLNLTADIMGSLNGGDYQLRIEDALGNRLLTQQTATGGWQSINLGDLTEFTEADASGTPTPNVFNENSPGYRIVVAFDNEIASWGTGGSLEFDNIFLNNVDPPDTTGSNYAAELFWDQLGPITAETFDELSLSADVKGSVVDAAYELRLECSKIVPTGGLQTFDDVTGTFEEMPGGQNFFEGIPDGLGTGNSTSNIFDDGIAGGTLIAFGGVVDGTTINGTGFTAEGLPDGGTGGTGDGAIAITADWANGLIGDPLTGWFGGFRLADQGLASTDLAQVDLTAMVKGTSNTGTAEIELRILDGDLDRLFFCVTATGGWQEIGGSLEDAEFGPAFNGGSNNVFDLDSEFYQVEVAYSRETTAQDGCDPASPNSWTPGSTIVDEATLTVDDVFLTPVDVDRLVGTATFNETATGDWQSVGGNLLDSETDFGGFLQDFDTVTDTGIDVTEADLGGQCCTGDLPWNTGLQNEDAAFGQFGSTFGPDGVATFQGCTDCGLNGSGDGGGQMIVQDITDGFWYAVVFWRNVRVDLSAGSGNFEFGHDLSGLADILLTADIKGTADLPGQTDTLSTYTLRVEDADLSAIQTFPVLADGTWQEVGGSLADTEIFEVLQIDGASEGFDFNQQTYTVTIAFVGGGAGDNSWLGGGTLSFDNIFMTGEDIADAETCIVYLSVEDALDTWGSGDAELTLDNLNLAAGCVADACFYCPLDASPGFAKNTQADIGGSNGACDPDGACDGNDRFAALNCFGNSSTLGVSPFPCEFDAPTAVNTDAGSGFDGTVEGTCARDGICDGNDAFHALNCFETDWFDGSTPYRCGCSGPQPQVPGDEDIIVPDLSTGVTLRAPARVQPGELFDVEVYFDDALEAARGYQLHLGVSGGESGTLELVDIGSNSGRKDHAFAGVPGVWSAFNRGIQQMVVGMDASEGVATTAGSYLATFTYRVPKDAAGDFVIDLRHAGGKAGPQERTFLFGAHAAPIAVSSVAPARVTVVDGPDRRGSLRVTRSR